VAALRNARATSAGGVVHRATPDGPEVVLVRRLSPPLWALPKGTPSAGETLVETALRETREETGLVVEIQQAIGPISYIFVRSGIRFHKTVHFFLMHAVGGDPAGHDHEFDEVRWLPLPEALRLMTYPTERGVVEQAERLLADARSPGRSPAMPETA